MNNDRLGKRNAFPSFFIRPLAIPSGLPSQSLLFVKVRGVRQTVSVWSYGSCAHSLPLIPPLPVKWSFILLNYW